MTASKIRAPSAKHDLGHDGVAGGTRATGIAQGVPSIAIAIDY